MGSIDYSSLTPVEQNFVNHLENAVDTERAASSNKGVKHVFSQARELPIDMKGLTSRSFGYLKQHLNITSTVQLEKVTRIMIKQLINRDVKEGDRLALAKVICDETAMLGGQAFANNLDMLDLKNATLEEQLALAKTICEKGQLPTCLLLVYINRFKFEQASLQQRLFLAEIICKQGSSAVGYFIWGCDKFKLEEASFEEQLALAKVICAQGENSSLALVTNLLPKFKLEATSLEDRLALVKAICGTEGTGSTLSLLQNLDKFGLGKNASFEDKLALVKAIAEQGEDAITTLSNNLKEVGYETMPPEERWRFVNAIVEQGFEAAETLACTFDNFGLENEPLEKRLELAKMIAEQGDYAGLNLLENLQHFVFPKDALPLEKRLELAQMIAKSGETAASTLLEDLDKFELGEISHEERLALATLIVQQGGEAAATLARMFDQIIPDAAPAERLTLAKLIAIQGDEAAENLVYNIDEIIKKASLHDRLMLARLMAEQGTQATMTLFSFFVRFGLHRFFPESQFTDTRNEWPLFLRLLKQNAIATGVLGALQAPDFMRRQALLEISRCEAPPSSHDLSDAFKNSQNVLPSVLPMMALFENEAEESLDEQINAFLTHLQSLSEKDARLAPFAQIFMRKTQEILAELLKNKQKSSAEHEFVKRQLWQWCAYATGVMLDLQPEQREALGSQPEWLDAILDFRAPSCRFALMRELSLLPAKTLNALPSRERLADTRLWILLSALQENKMITPALKAQIYTFFSWNFIKKCLKTTLSVPKQANHRPCNHLSLPIFDNNRLYLTIYQISNKAFI